MLKNLFLFFIIACRFQKGNSLRGRYHRKAHHLLVKLLDELGLDKKMASDRLALKARWYAVQLMWVMDNILFIYTQYPKKYGYEAAAYCGFIFGLSDYLIDDLAWETGRLNDMIYPQASFDNSWIGNLYFLSYCKFCTALSGKDNKDEVMKQYGVTFQAQIRSSDQLNATISKEEIEHITARKCGSSIHLALALANQYYATDLDAWYAIGAFVQFCNDIQDLRKDLVDKVRNFATERAGFYEMGRDLIKQYNKCAALIHEMAISKPKKRYLAFQYYVFLTGTLAKLHVYKKRIGNYDPRKMMNIKKEAVRIKPASYFTIAFILRNLKYGGYKQPVNESLIKNLTL